MLAHQHLPIVFNMILRVIFASSYFSVFSRFSTFNMNFLCLIAFVFTGNSDKLIFSGQLILGSFVKISQFSRLANAVSSLPCQSSEMVKVSYNEK